jgi:hypothetical protein
MLELTIGMDIRLYTKPVLFLYAVLCPGRTVDHARTPCVRPVAASDAAAAMSRELQECRVKQWRQYGLE